jgi:hypothetical protein
MKAEITVPTSLNDLTLEQYQAFLRIQDTSDSPEFISQKMISIFCKIPLSQVLYIKHNSITDIITGFNDMFEAERKFIHRFSMGGKEFGFIPSLEDISGEFIDLENNISDWQKMHKAMAVMFRPITKVKGDKYEIETYHGTANYSDVMKYAPLDVVLGAVVFFYALGNELLNLTLRFIQEEAEVMISQKKRSLVKDGDGISQSMHSLKATLEGLEKLQVYHSPLVLPH